MVCFYPDRETVFFLPNLSISFCGVLTHFLRARALSREGRAGRQFLYNNPSDPQRLLLNLPSAASYLTKSFLPFLPFSPRIVSPFCAALFRAPPSSLSDQEPRKPRGQPKLRGHCWLRDKDKGQLGVCVGVPRHFLLPLGLECTASASLLAAPGGKKKDVFSTRGQPWLPASLPFLSLPALPLHTDHRHPAPSTGFRCTREDTLDNGHRQAAATGNNS